MGNSKLEITQVPASCDFRVSRFRFQFSIFTSVAAREINPVEQFPAIEPSFQQLDQNRCLAVPQPVARSAGVRRDEQIWCFPEGPFGGKALWLWYIPPPAA